MNLHALKYATVLTGFAFGLFSLLKGGWWSFSLPLYAFGLIPLLELIIKPETYNLSSEEEEKALRSPLFDALVYLIVPLQIGILILFLFKISEPQLWYEYAGRTLSMGIGCGVFGINVGHELGHRKPWHEQFMAKILLLTSLYLHFFIDHNRGHHKKVSTPEDPSSARRGEILYAFWFRSAFGSWFSAWKLEAERLRKEKKPVFSFHNEMLIFQVIQLILVVVIAIIFNWQTMLFFILAAIIGALHLETVNYIEHYGLQRRIKADGKYERVMPHHSWNSNHMVGRIMLFELSRHSDHHFKASRKYQILRHIEGTPQMPTGYPGMVILSLIPPLWFSVMHPHIERYFSENKQAYPAFVD